MGDRRRGLSGRSSSKARWTLHPAKPEIEDWRFMVSHAQRRRLRRVSLCLINLSSMELI